MLLNKLTTYIKWKFAKTFYTKDAYDWFIVQHLADRFKKGKLVPLNNYWKGECKSKRQKRVVCIFDERKLHSGGLVDRLRGIVSTYIVCKESGIDFRILFTHPFRLERYLTPNKIDWRISADELTYNLKETDLCHLTTLNGNDYESQKQEIWMRKEFKKEYNEFHIFTNAIFSYKYNFKETFFELFQPSPLLLKLIKDTQKHLGKNYISTSFRFLNLLGDFNETSTNDIKLSNAERHELINKNINQLMELHQKNPGLRILVNSDSITFLQEADKFDFTYIIPGEISHVDSKEFVKESAHDKTFTDFFSIAHAKEIYLFITGNMYNSGFPYAASLIYGKPFYRKYF